MSIFDQLLNPAQVGGAFAQGMATGRKEREEREVKGALAAYAVNPDDPAAFKTLATHKPELAIKIAEDRREKAKKLEAQRLTAAAAAGDKTAAAQLAGIDLDAWDKLADNQRQSVKTRAEYIGNAALQISRLPEAERPAAWDAAVTQGKQFGVDGLDGYVGKYSPEALNSALASAGQVKTFLDMNEPKYQALPEGGTLVNTNDPNAVRSYMGGLGALASAQTKTIGGKTYFQTPDGKWHDDVPGGAGSGQPGFP